MIFFTPLPLLLVTVVFLAHIVQRAFPCSNIGFFEAGCNRILPDPKCNIFGNNCLVCAYDFFHKDQSKEYCSLYVSCSCYYCCEKQYAKDCPQGCQNCRKDGEGGCPENNKPNARLVSSRAGGNSTFVHPLEEVKHSRQKFDTIDADKSGTISMKEAIAYLVDTKNGTSANHLAKNNAWFGHMDINGNRQIEPMEFDRMLI
ncbi:hypothetical protein niasHS_004774 [Heterodera schachtii]|uniref:EF-hand domain-containing protein n=1 Tax=Heterodera schachtii TaxID=97005 RepID=A0ABD2JVA9_HETSC